MYRFTQTLIMTVIILVLLALCLISVCHDHQNNLHNVLSAPSVPMISIDKETFDMYVNVVTRLSLVYTTPIEKYIMIYIATFSLFNENYQPELVQNLDNKLRGSMLFKQDIIYPEFDKYHNLQTFIANSVNSNIVDGERMLIGNYELDRQIIHVYLWALFNDMKILK